MQGVMEEQWLTPQQIADRLQLDLKTVRRRLRRGELKGYKFGQRGDWRIRESDLIAFMEKSTTVARREVDQVDTGSTSPSQE